ncbi:hypothetical protein MOQ_003077 [Trypanosoma cruzi marinkellei]|uniref:Uncharacterized protein n=1 Tax=Trypanosoma cruzi marinkellei TaxID=85056 RepID=K2N521_TRYCR|nr:hypothetical protein MOQ_003077 [Trypanosoma cruzi marinkellei]
MPAVDVDLTAIPDMIEAQLTLSYSRLAKLVRLIVDQGNGHDVDIDKLNSRIDALARENAELKALVESFMEEKSRESWVQTSLDELRHEISCVSDACAESSKQLASAMEEVHHRFDDVDQQLKSESNARANEVNQINTFMNELQEVIRDMRLTLSQCNGFVEVWEGKAEKTEALTRRDAEGGFQHSTEDRVDYLRSLPVFANVFEEMDVLRQMLRQQAADALSAKSAAGAIRRFSTAEIAASGGNNANIFDRSVIDGMQDSLGNVLKRLRELEERQTPAFGRPQLQQQQQSTAWRGEKDDIIQLENRLQNVEDRLSNLSFQASEGASLEKALLTDVDGRLRSLENRIDGFPLARLSKQEQQGEGEDRLPVIAGQQTSKAQPQPQPSAPAVFTRRVPAPMGKDVPTGETGEGRALPYLNTVPLNGRVEASNAQAVQGVGDRSNSGVRSFVNQSNSELKRNSNAISYQSSPQPQATVQDDGVMRRLAQLEENSAVLEMKKADRHELAKLEDVLRNILQNPAVLPTSALARGIVPHRPTSQQDARGIYATENAYSSPPSTSMKSPPPGRPMFVGGSAHQLRDSAGAATPATLSTFHAV